MWNRLRTLLAIVDIMAVQSSAQTFIHNTILFIDTFNNAWHNQADWLIGTPYLSTIASNVNFRNESTVMTAQIYLLLKVLAWTLAQISMLESDWLFAHHPIPNVKYPPITALSNKSTYHKCTKGFPPSSPQIPKSMNKLTLNELAITALQKNRKHSSGIDWVADS